MLLNLEDSPENLHFEMSLVRATLDGTDMALDVAHAFRHEYDFIERVVNPKGRRLPARACASWIDRPYAGAVFLDIPRRKPAFLHWMRFLMRGRFGRRIFVANRPLAPGREVLRTLGSFDRAHIMRQDDSPDLRSCLRPGALRLRDHALDCGHYAPQKDIAEGDSIFSAGTEAMDFPLLARAAAATGMRARIFTDGPEDWEPGPGVDVYGHRSNLDRLRASIAEARLVAVPIKADAEPWAGVDLALMGMAAGKTVVARDTPWMRRYVREGVTGRLYRGGSLESLTRALRRACQSPRRRRALGRQARRAALRLANLDRVASGLVREACGHA